MIGGGLLINQIVLKFIRFGVDGVNVFQSTKMVLQNKCMTHVLFIQLGSIRGPITLIWWLKHCWDYFW